MNEKARAIGLETVSFINTSGLPEKTGENTMSTKEIFLFSKYIIENYPEVLAITDEISITIPDRNYKKDNTNPLLKLIPDVDGLKTGYTDKAGYCLVSTIQVPKSVESEKDFRLIGIIMGAKSEKIRENKSKELLEYGINNFSYRNVLLEKSLLGNIKVNNAKNTDVEIFPINDTYILSRKDSLLTIEVIVDDNLKAPINKGQKVGKVIINNNGQNIKEVDVVIGRDVEKANFLVRIYRYLMNLVGR